MSANEITALVTGGEGLDHPNFGDRTDLYKRRRELVPQGFPRHRPAVVGLRRSVQYGS
jgi:hypothetical protein